LQTAAISGLQRFGAQEIALPARKRTLDLGCEPLRFRRDTVGELAAGLAAAGVCTRFAAGCAGLRASRGLGGRGFR